MNKYWKDEDVEMLSKVSTFEEIAEIAFTILARMRETGHPIVQVCGPISTGGLGDLRKNLERFHRAVKKADVMGLAVFDQVPFQVAIERIDPYTGTNGYCMDILEKFYRPIFESGHISKALFLPGWEGSKGATWEREVLTTLGIHIEEYPEEWLRDI